MMIHILHLGQFINRHINCKDREKSFFFWILLLSALKYYCLLFLVNLELPLNYDDISVPVTFIQGHKSQKTLKTTSPKICPEHLHLVFIMLLSKTGNTMHQNFLETEQPPTYRMLYNFVCSETGA